MFVWLIITINNNNVGLRKGLKGLRPGELIWGVVSRQLPFAYGLRENQDTINNCRQ